MRINRLKTNQLCIGRTNDLAGDGTQSATPGLYIGTVTTGQGFGGTYTAGLAMDGTYTYGIHFSGTATNQIFVANGTTGVAIKLGTLSSTTAGSGCTLSDTVTRIVEINADDNDTARSTGIQGRCLAARLMAYNGSHEDWAVDGLTKWSTVAKTDNVSAGVTGRFETTGNCSITTGNNAAVAAVMGRIGTGATFTIGASTVLTCFLAFNNTQASAQTQTGKYCAFATMESALATMQDFTDGIYIKANTCTTGMTIEACTTGIAITGATTTGISITGNATDGLKIATGTFTDAIEIAGTTTNAINISGAVTTGLLIAGATTNAISITGASSTASISVAHTLAAEDDIAIKLVTSSSGTGAATINYINCAHTSSGTGNLGGRALFQSTFSGYPGSYCNALKGYAIHSHNGSNAGTGLASAICAELTVPNATVASGAYFPYEAELNLPSSHVPQAHQLGFFYLSPNTTASLFDTHGVLFYLAGVTKGEGKVFDDCTAAAASHALRISIAGTYYYILLQANVDA